MSTQNEVIAQTSIHSSQFTHPSVLRNPQTLPSAYSDTISPRCRKLDESIFESFIIEWTWVNTEKFVCRSYKSKQQSIETMTMYTVICWYWWEFVSNSSIECDIFVWWLTFEFVIHSNWQAFNSTFDELIAWLMRRCCVLLI